MAVITVTDMLEDVVGMYMHALKVKEHEPWMVASTDGVGIQGATCSRPYELRFYRDTEVISKAEAPKKIKCKYCGISNPAANSTCGENIHGGCGAPL